jgi:DNA-binding response OmpR family regulator
MATHRVVLLVESEAALLDSLGFALRRRGYHVLTARDGDRAAELLARQLPDVVVSNLMLPGPSGFQLAQLAKERSDGRTRVVLLSRLAGALRDYALALGADRYLTLPLAPAGVVAAVEAVCPLSGSGTIAWPLATPA